MASYQRIVSITDFKVTKLKEKAGQKAEGQTVTAEFLVTAYYVSPEKLQPAAPEKKPKPAPADKPAAE
jgi:hypothetical protein